MLEKIVEICLKVSFVFLDSSCVMVVLFVFGGFQKIIELSEFVLIICVSVLFGFVRCFCLEIFVSDFGCSCLVSGCFDVKFFGLCVVNRLFIGRFVGCVVCCD